MQRDGTGVMDSRQHVPSAASARPRRRSRQEVKRPRTVRFDLSEEEFAEIGAAARRAGLAKGAYAAQIVLAAARSGTSPGESPAAGGAGRVHPGRRAGPPHRGQPQPGRGQAERHRPAQRRPPPVRGGEHPPGPAPRPGRRGSAEADPAMIGKVSPHGQRVTGLIYYLFGPGREAEHTDPHIVAGWRHPAELEPPLRERRPPRLPPPDRPAPAATRRPRPARIAPPRVALLRPGRPGRPDPLRR